MEKNFPFTSYDFWAVLSAGFLLLVVVDYVIGSNLLMRERWTVAQGAIAVSAAYAVGHLVAGLSYWLLENGLVRKMLGAPSTVLFGQPPARPWLRALVPGYFVALPPNTQKAALTKGAEIGAAAPGEDLFWPAFNHAKSVPAVMSRAQVFMNLYGFCRNTALVAFIDAGLLAVSHWWFGGPSENLTWALVAFIGGIGMTYRYLRFYRTYAVELFTSYAYAK